MSLRQDWAAHFMKIAHVVAEMATCDRKHVGCVIVQNRRIISTGFNGSLPGLSHCDEVGHDMVEGHCVRTIHAEANAVVQAAHFGISLAGSEAYVNVFPCWPCFKLLASAGVRQIWYDDVYRPDERVEKAAQKMAIVFRPIVAPAIPT